MASADEFNDVMHSHIDALEDAALDGSQALVVGLKSVDPQTFLRVAAAGNAEALSRAIAGTVTRNTLRSVEAAALDTVTVLSGVNARDRIKPLDSGLRLFGPASTKIQIDRTQSLISDRLTTTQNELRRLTREVSPRSKAEARLLLARIEQEVLGPLRDAATWHEPMNRVAMGGAEMAMSAADVMLEKPKLSPDQALIAADSALMVWHCALVKTCHDCLPRHGNTDTRANWRRRGRPRSGWSVCRGYCRCQLLPAFGEGGLDVPSHSKLTGPLRREKMALVKEGSPRSLSVRVPDALLKEESATLRSKAARRGALKKAYEDDIRVRRAMRLLGRVNA